MVSILASYQTSAGSIPSVPQIFSEEKLTMLLRLINRKVDNGLKILITLVQFWLVACQFYQRKVLSSRWNCPLPESEVPQDVIRLLMLRDSTTKGRKLLFDSMTTSRDDFSNKNLRKINFEEYEQITDGFGYKVLNIIRSKEMSKQLLFD